MYMPFILTHIKNISLNKCKCDFSLIIREQIIIIIGLLIHMAVKTELHGMNYKTIAIWLVIFNSNKVPKSFSISRYKI